MHDGITRRSFLAAAAPAILRAQKTSPSKMNVLFIAADDLNVSLGCYGHPVVRTPNLDRLASRSMRFDRAYCQFPLCGPSRTSLLSGMRPDSTRILANEIAVRDTMPDVVTLPQLMRQNGWHSARFGKMYHMNVPGSVGKNLFDDPPSWDVAVSPPGAEDKTPGEGRNITPNLGAGNSNSWISFNGGGKEQADHAVAEYGIDTIDKQGDKPWFMGLGFVRPHVPYVAPARFFDLYPLSQMKPVENPPNDRDDIPKASEITINTRANDMGGMNDRDKRESLRAYYASISYMDSLVGRVLDHLDRQRLTDRTLIVFWSDHGYHLGEHFRWHKRSLFEESARVPLIVSAPGHARGKSTRALVELVDMYPSIAELCGVRAPDTVEGQSFVPLLDNPARAWKQAAFTQVHTGTRIIGRSVRTDRYRYIRWEGELPDEELYDHATDPREFTNLARDGRQKEAVSRMRSVLDAGWRAAMARV